MDVLEENSTNWLIMTDDGSTETKTKSSELNQLLYGQNLWGLLDTGDEIWNASGADEEPPITIIPDDEATCFTLVVGDAPKLNLGAHQKTRLISSLKQYYSRDDDSVAPIVELYDSIRSNMIRKDLLSLFLDAFGDRIEEREDGWFIHGHLLLTFEGEFYHSENVSRSRSGRIIGEGTSVEAYNLNFDKPGGDMKREVEKDGETFRLTDSEVTFLAQAMWAIENTTER
jgi:hypothetical protein